MNGLAAVSTETAISLVGIVDRAATALAMARSAAEVLDARDLASIAYDAAKKAARLAKAKRAHDDLMGTALRAQADALEIQSEAKRRLADEYDAAQERGEVAGHGGDRKINVPDGNVETIGLTRKEIHEARIIRDAEKADPGIIRRVLDQALAEGVEPTKARVKKAVSMATQRAAKPRAIQSANVVDLPIQTSSPARGTGAICERVAQAIITLSGLPPAEEVAAWFKGAEKASTIEERIDRAAPWLAAFHLAWRKQ